MSLKFSLINLAAVFVLAFLFIKFMPAIPTSSVVTQKTDLFTVSGTGKVTVVPDTAIIDMGITSSKPSVKDAQNQANTTISAVTKALKGLGIEDKDIKTSNYSIYPQYDYQSGSATRITSYQVTANITVVVRDLEKANQAIDLATSNGANSIGGIQLTVAEEKQKELVEEARNQAVEEAKTKAESLAKAAGITLGRVVNVQESGANPIVPMMARDSVKLEGMGGGGAPTEIQAGSTDISSSVTLFYETR